MNIYLLPVYDTDVARPEILKFKAKDVDSAEDKVVEYFQKKYDFDGFVGGTDWDDFCDYVADQLLIVIGDFYDIEEFEDRLRY